ncbi:hybrid sensor histidine kinase/response regulator [Paracoccus shanxieyensis]|uniref:histidine kinase n=1 Tax=Paracoccus shanxieyensis TaxID=2675752 RepID=A0A6L6IUU8_9RHOB|nr:PAS-domain containing protein [Paracoccus shanxieyensis]MTH64276.1 response regulator [Paracoccus shanxieyensis]MTH87420.1 response regulator [Paracoccus shanxieyensis]
MSARISDPLIDPDAPASANVEKLLIIADALMRNSEQNNGDRSAAFEEFHRAAVLEDRVRQRTRDLEATLELLNQANAATERARRDLSQAIEAIEEGFALFDAAGALVLCNSRFCRALPDVQPFMRAGLTMRDYIRICSLSAHLALPAGVMPADWEQTRLRRHRQRQVFNVELTGDRWLQVSEQHVAGGGTVILQTDVTQMMRLERSERGRLLDDQARMIRATLEHLNQGVGIFDAGRRLIGWNWRLAQMLALPSAMLRQGTPFSALLGQSRWQFQLAGGVHHADLVAWVRTRSGRPALSFEMRHVSDIVLAVSAQEMPGRGFVLSLSDVTRERMAIHAMLRANATLEARVTARTEELAEALAHAERANSTRVRFVAAASHDLLQPLSAAKLFVAGARDDAETPKLHATLVKAHNALTSVEAILGALLDISRLEGGGSEVEITPVPLDALLKQLTDEFAPAATAKGLQLDILPSRMVVRSDATYLRRILQNLISNAIRYTAQGRILVGPRRVPSGVRIEVHDTGPGISPDEQVAIFREFHRINASASAAEGMGLGLAIVDRACKLLGHKLVLQSQPGRGTCFSVELPMAPAHLRPAMPDTPPQIPIEPGEHGGRIVLLVENDDDLRAAMSQSLDRLGVSVIEAENGEDALALLDEIGITPDICLIDYQLGPGMTGVALAVALAAQHGPRPTRIITANRSPQIRAAAREVGLEIIWKPVDPEELAGFVLADSIGA